jgi:hypothetical protein
MRGSRHAGLVTLRTEYRCCYTSYWFAEQGVVSNRLLVLQGCNIMSDWVPELQFQGIERLQGEACHTGFRLFLAANEAAPMLSAAVRHGATIICWEAPQVLWRSP